MAASRPCTTTRIVAALLAFLSFVTTVSAQQISPSNATSDIPPYDSSPRFWINGTGNPPSDNFSPFRVAPLGWYSQISQQNFLSIQITGRLVYVDTSNANSFITNAFDYISCDPEDYPGVLSPNDVLRMVVTANQGNAIVLYSTRANHCQAGSLRSLAVANGIFTTLDPAIAATVVSQLRNSSSIGMPGVISPDAGSYTKPYAGGGSSASQSSATPGPTTAVAMIILYTITGIITALFVVIIVTGAVRAHRHPERYGPSNIVGRPRRSRAKGIARAMLDTIPIVKFGEQKDEPATLKKGVGDIEMATGQATTLTAEDKGKTASSEVTEAEDETNKPTSTGAISTAPTTNPDGTDDAGQLGCSICTEDFTKGDEVRLLPCNHKFHPECVDPWLLNVSGTCPLCRIDLRPKEEQTAQPTTGESSTSRQGSTTAATTTQTMYEAMFAPPLTHLPLRLDRERSDRERSDRRASNAGRRDTVAFANLRSVASGSREDRIAALRRFRQQRRNRGENEMEQPEEESRGLSSRLRERFRIRTRRLGEDDVAATGAMDSTAGPSSTSTPPAR
ncbi:hypothetical protein H2198_003781 [Neophaeococcomyces mojaviensis]|uniref:Uncharacterized protein n=1 Tax=Neophaeococcomyces mojaviensis TaxID=3383035 RepID=A0ACC3AAV3_9EURO|nr:hypothetical protein H2198_003781 [Knufia sp. JES_112]